MRRGGEIDGEMERLIIEGNMLYVILLWFCESVHLLFVGPKSSTQPQIDVDVGNVRADSPSEF